MAHRRRNFGKLRWVVVLPSGKVKQLTQKSWESKDEFRGRALTDVEHAVTGKRVGPMPAGTRWAKAEAPDWFRVYESTGRAYTDRHTPLPGFGIIRTVAEAKRAIRRKNSGWGRKIAAGSRWFLDKQVQGGLKASKYGWLLASGKLKPEDLPDHAYREWQEARKKLANRRKNPEGVLYLPTIPPGMSLSHYLSTLRLPPRTNPRRRNWPRAAQADRHMATELVLYATNNLYFKAKAIMKALRRKILQGTYDKDMSVRAWQYLAGAAAKAYTREFSVGESVAPATRKLAAADLADHYDEELWDFLSPAQRAEWRAAGRGWKHGKPAWVKGMKIPNSRRNPGRRHKSYAVHAKDGASSWTLDLVKRKKHAMKLAKKASRKGKGKVYRWKRKRVSTAMALRTGASKWDVTEAGSFQRGKKVKNSLSPVFRFGGGDVHEFRRANSQKKRANSQKKRRR